ncbi:preprotein translocase subunit SecD [Mycobacterium sp. 1081908.1]|uniref:SecDF P1 head subdomain-containing protein n=1 Tax=Mycobacterium sp. 1081908.1 TaxID=1834066 RepID=UPI0007FD6DBC|nr:preprotein translocase subunit SecD [Mycobacterium sp. 1081908.1]OBK48154.1 preprotein translocase subunit SecD [Mycobacterium sp. 1081908.1]
MIHRGSRGSRGLTSALLLAAVACGCQSTPHHNAPTRTTTTAAPTTTQPAAPAVVIQPLPVRPVQKSQPAAPSKCPATNPSGPVAPTASLVTCDLARTTLYTLGPETMRLALIHVDPPASLTSGFYEVSLTMDPQSAAAWATFTATHLQDHVAFIRDDLVLEAPIIVEQVTSGKIALTTQTAQAADQLAQLAGRPA